jgi:transcriptional regulator with XRE-family HTH domain
MANRAKTISSKTGIKIRELRNLAGFTQKELAEKLYKSESAVRMWELGKSEPDLLSVNALAELFSVSADVILGTDTPTPEAPQLSEGEQLLLDMFRQIPEDQQKVFLEMGRVYANSLKKD